MHFLSVILLVCASAVSIEMHIRKPTLDLVILHTNDMHARFEETSKISAKCSEPGIDKTCVGGFARVAYLVRQARKTAQEGGPKVLFLNAGDTYTGTTWFTLFRWNITKDFMNILQPDAMCLGNHEFDDEPSGLAPFLREINFPVVTTNIDYSLEPELSNLGNSKIRKSLVIEIEGRKIGIVGYLTPQTVNIANPGNVKFEDEIISLQKETKKLKEQGVKIIIALGHSGYEMDKKIAKHVPLVDVVVGGHTDTFLWNGPQIDLEEPVDVYPKVIVQNSGKEVPVVQAFGYTKYIGRLHVVFDDNGDLIRFGGQPVLLYNSIPREKDVIDLLDKYRPAFQEQFEKFIGKTKVVLDGVPFSCRNKECNMGNLIADAFVAYFTDEYRGNNWTDTSIAIINGGGIKNSIEPTDSNDGNITIGDLLSVLPYQNYIEAGTINGSDLLKTLELGVRATDGSTSKGEFLQVSGIHVTYDLTKPVGYRVVDAKARCSNCKIPTYEPVKDDKFYRIASTNFITKGGDGFYTLKNLSNKTVSKLKDADLLAWYIGSNKLFYPATEERIRIMKNSSDPCKVFFIPILSILSLAFIVIEI